MKFFLRLTLAMFAINGYVACAKKKFLVDEAKIAEFCSASNGCVHTSGRDYFNYSTTASSGQVDILFVDDNSGSMSFEQQRMAARFSTFIQQLDSQFVDYRIGITTTDIYSGNNAALTDSSGNTRLISFANGSSFLTPQSGSQQDRISWFGQAIQRPETSTCEAFVRASVQSGVSIAENSDSYRQNCPAGDERGIYSANRVITQNPSSMIRPQGHLAIVILSDEDVRSSNYHKGTSNNYPLEDGDLPSNLISNLKSKFPDKTLTIHSIIVRPGSLSRSIDDLAPVLHDFTFDPINSDYSDYRSPSYISFFSGGDSACLSSQSNQIPGAGFSGSYGYLYALASRMTGGVEGDICASDYGSQLTAISNMITERIQEVALRCNQVSNLSVSFSPTSSAVSFVLDGSTLRFSQPLDPGTQLDLSYSCPSVF